MALVQPISQGLRTFRSAHYTLRLKRWWLPSERKAARFALLFWEAHWQEAQKEIARRIIYGE